MKMNTMRTMHSPAEGFLLRIRDETCIEAFLADGIKKELSRLFTMIWEEMFFRVLVRFTGQTLLMEIRNLNSKIQGKKIKSITISRRCQH